MPKTVLITGGCGYLGSQFVRDLAKNFQDYHLRILDNLQRHSYQALMNLPEAHLEFIEGDLLDRAVIRHALQNVDVIVHLAAIVRTPMSFEHPTWMNQVNHWGTAQLIEEAIQAGVSHFVYASSTAVYGPGGPFSEQSSGRPIGPYAQSKFAAERVILAAQKRGLEATILRLGMLFGVAPYMRFDGFINRLIFLAAVGKPLSVYGQGTQRRPCLHVTDASRTLITALQGGFDESVLNVACANYSVNDVVSFIQSLRPDVEVFPSDQGDLAHLSFEVDCRALMAYGHTFGDTQRCIDELLKQFGQFHVKRYESLADLEF